MSRERLTVLNANKQKPSRRDIVFSKLHEISNELFAIEAQLESLEVQGRRGNHTWEELQVRKDELIEMGEKLADKIRTQEVRKDELVEMGEKLADKTHTQVCNNCYDNLFGKPKIDVESVIYCYHCAKQKVQFINSERHETSKRLYEQIKQEYEQRKANHQIAMAEWYSKRTPFVEQGRIGFWPSVGLVIVIGLMTNQLVPGKGLGLLAFIVSAIIWCYISFKKTRRKEMDFQKKYPAPKFGESDPKYEGFKAVYHYLMNPDGSKLKSIKNYRIEVFYRDNFTCQNCGNSEKTDDLEVHHIMPVALGGLDDPTNLITLCIRCHDREDWYGHVRKYPTTIYSYVGAKKSKKYHYNFCKYALKISPNNLTNFKSLREAQAAGYKPCYLCNPNQS
jgi:hypothetical protein